MSRCKEKNVIVVLVSRTNDRKRMAYRRTDAWVFMRDIGGRDEGTWRELTSRGGKSDRAGDLVKLEPGSWRFHHKGPIQVSPRGSLPQEVVGGSRYLKYRLHSAT